MFESAWWRPCCSPRLLVDALRSWKAGDVARRDRRAAAFRTPLLRVRSNGPLYRRICSTSFKTKQSQRTFRRSARGVWYLPPRRRPGFHREETNRYRRSPSSRGSWRRSRSSSRGSTRRSDQLDESPDRRFVLATLLSNCNIWPTRSPATSPSSWGRFRRRIAVLRTSESSVHMRQEGREPVVPQSTEHSKEAPSISQIWGSLRRPQEVDLLHLSSSRTGEHAVRTHEREARA